MSDSTELTRFLIRNHATIFEIVDEARDSAVYPRAILHRYYGSGTNIRVDSALRAQTCKFTDNGYEQFTFQSDTKRLRMDQYQRCIEAAAPESGAQLIIR